MQQLKRSSESSATILSDTKYALYLSKEREKEYLVDVHPNCQLVEFYVERHTRDDLFSRCEQYDISMNQLLQDMIMVYDDMREHNNDIE